MIKMHLLFVLTLVLIRLMAGYDSRFQKSKHIAIQNRTVRILLIDKTSFLEKSERLDDDANKITLTGVLLYTIAFLVLVINIVMLCFVPTISIEPWVFEIGDFGGVTESLNEKTCIVAIWLFFLLTVSCLANDLFRYAKSIQQKWIRICAYIVSLGIFAGSVFCAFGMIKELIVG